MNPIILIIVLIASTLIGYKLISNVPSLLHTPLMSGMNALSGVTVIGAIAAAGLSFKFGHDGKLILGQIFGGLAIILATINVVGGFGVTHRMLRMFSKKKKGGDQ
ncbi:NAD(P) transhydrogenase subunit alpha [Porphyromonas gingivalis]|jgi:probable NADPH-NAD transhydrogenase alpha subunit|uniref:proton-translocating NAD(P)(+) transhydrogenase n=3 Tax=Porphyromonas gingivalis TaxID=837 RepID=A0A134DP58_PORGN|nr:NAD(P) transhydrogenase subunit alpha [Porphyromonas gingivalis]EOA11728.1 PF12769 domain protein [Porphyromonas gingivalis JCVI SC001]MCG5079832.1 NAD(P) transhydrogenase subunit alpha [Candidatus Saccharibacteria bacterium]AIJ35897.1 pyridine nucleotide transhydrogenase [Porphyromonas gingivalis]AKV63849.1 putative pyridine nucleotide transhydrogenase subunit [Porphyromonas gingivalis]ALA93174.1 putative pyridine nucleotide transhydrogenase subunit [Porphyromonas gingivalis AJW4]